MDDLIKRQDAFDVIDKIFPADQKRNDYTQGITCGAALAKEYIKQLSSARKKGHWIDGSCSLCGCDEPMFMVDWNVEYCKTPFCPNCGADMENYED